MERLRSFWGGSKLASKCLADLGHLKTNRFHKWNPECPVHAVHWVKISTTMAKYVKIRVCFRLCILFIIVTIFLCVWKTFSKTTTARERTNRAMKMRFFLRHALIYPLHADINYGVWKCFKSTNTSTPIFYCEKKRVFRNGWNFH